MFLYGIGVCGAAGAFKISLKGFSVVYVMGGWCYGFCSPWHHLGFLRYNWFYGIFESYGYRGGKRKMQTELKIRVFRN